ncbi:hypothetical protein ES332_D02G049600v1 [Gossypium tomentosum]|uniref:Uncharacterized protein n=1 Tax=Gossypium tomentosum TaxID=34277 RepID=A0A5D2LTA9_GOSTO|nr:hypothetical protein ES332_D02G049600v1 [Gossypium tomentosum]
MSLGSFRTHQGSDYDGVQRLRRQGDCAAMAGESDAHGSRWRGAGGRTRVLKP